MRSRLQILRDLVTPSNFNYDSSYRANKEDELVPIATRLLRDEDIGLQHEAVELLRALLIVPRLQVSWHGIVHWCKDPRAVIVVEIA